MHPEIEIEAAIRPSRAAEVPHPVTQVLPHTTHSSRLTHSNQPSIRHLEVRDAVGVNHDSVGNHEPYIGRPRKNDR